MNADGVPVGIALGYCAGYNHNVYDPWCSLGKIRRENRNSEMVRD